MGRIAIVGAGSWGTALGIIAGRAGHQVRLWSRNAEVVEAINGRHVNSVYLGQHEIPSGVEATNNLSEALSDAELVLLAAPSHVTRELLVRMLPGLQPLMIFVSATKGIEIETGKRISEVVRDVVGELFEPRFVCLSGPSFAQEVAAGHPTAVVAASYELEDARLVQEALSFQNLRIYTNTDVVGAEIGGSVKNVMAVAAGMVAGLGLGTNSIAALITRGLAEITRFALAQGARLETLMGLAGMGDLVLTCTGGLSRNRYVGQELGKGRQLEEIVSGMHEVAEGVKTTLAVNRLAIKLNVEMPITSEVHAVLYQGKQVRDAAGELMLRPLRGETEKF
ncbi:MAG TPA: NAD(P)H-dependent glycerol-3-phosphate dehydrogenase [Pyrinomonadaceae bacterium]|jgi:glycerol-3-phosphate dehydrogenase (NAD(P)+)|nr:NAD(P)H-dependent glycerol-3-phosphate dehydrogenase [Pyrinomonadaceae bacterium]